MLPKEGGHVRSISELAVEPRPAVIVVDKSISPMRPTARFRPDRPERRVRHPEQTRGAAIWRPDRPRRSPALPRLSPVSPGEDSQRAKRHRRPRTKRLRTRPLGLVHHRLPSKSRAEKKSGRNHTVLEPIVRTTGPCGRGAPLLKSAKLAPPGRLARGSPAQALRCGRSGHRGERIGKIKVCLRAVEGQNANLRGSHESVGEG